MSLLHLVEAPIELAELHGFAERRGLTRHGMTDEGIALHHLLSESFGKAALQPFRLMVAERARKATLYAYSRSDHGGLARIAANAQTPDAARVLDPGRLASLPRPASAWRTGQRLGFDLRLRPIVRLRQGIGAHGPGDETDAFLAEALRRHSGDPRGMEASGRTREAVYLDWLAARLGPAASLEPGACRMVRFQRLRVLRGGRPVEGPEAIVHGTLTVDDPARFADLLAGGVGRHRAYGFGMLLLRPPSPRC